MAELARLDGPEAVVDTRDPGRTEGQGLDGVVGGQAGLDRVPDLAEELVDAGEAVAGEAEGDVGFAQEPGEGDALVPRCPGLFECSKRAIALLEGLLAVFLLRGDLGSFGEVDAEDDRTTHGLQTVGDLVRLPAADDDRPRAELLGEVEDAMDRVEVVRLPPRGQRAGLRVVKGFQGRVVGWQGASLFSGEFERLVVVFGVEHRLSEVGDHAHQGAGEAPGVGRAGFGHGLLDQAEQSLILRIMGVPRAVLVMPEAEGIKQAILATPRVREVNVQGNRLFENRLATAETSERDEGALTGGD